MGGWRFWTRGKKGAGEGEDVLVGDTERRFKANDPEYNKGFKYAVSPCSVTAGVNID